jgi:hypothetical protein
MQSRFELQLLKPLLRLQQGLQLSAHRQHARGLQSLDLKNIIELFDFIYFEKPLYQTPIYLYTTVLKLVGLHSGRHGGGHNVGMQHGGGQAGSGHGGRHGGLYGLSEKNNIILEIRNYRLS